MPRWRFNKESFIWRRKHEERKTKHQRIKNRNNIMNYKPLSYKKVPQASSIWTQLKIKDIVQWSLRVLNIFMLLNLLSLKDNYFYFSMNILHFCPCPLSGFRISMLFLQLRLEAHTEISWFGQIIELLCIYLFYLNFKTIQCFYSSSNFNLFFLTTICRHDLYTVLCLLYLFFLPVKIWNRRTKKVNNRSCGLNLK